MVKAMSKWCKFREP